MLHRFATNIAKKGLFSNEDKLLVAVSGGLDSMVLCDLLLKTGYTYAVAHCNFGLRAEEADGDERLVEEFCDQNKLTVYRRKFETEKYARESRISIQMAARELRYKWFNEVMRMQGLNYLLTAHHLNDNIETFFINLLRGSGINGLKGIEEKKESVIRPLLDFTKDELTSYAKKHKVIYREDKSNTEDKYLRNYLRLHIMPKLKEVSPSYEQIFKEELRSLQDTYGIVKEHVEACRERICEVSAEFVKISISGLKKESSLSLILFELLRPYKFNSSTVRNIEESLDTEPGKLFYSGSHELLRDREHLVIRKRAAAEENRVYYIGEDNTIFKGPVTLTFSKSTKNDELVNANPGIIVDADKLIFPLTLEKWKRGDKFRPPGLKGSKKLSDFFTEEKMSVFEKQEQWLLKSNGDIVWVIGRRMDARYSVTKETRNCMVIELLRS